MSEPRPPGYDPLFARMSADCHAHTIELRRREYLQTIRLDPDYREYHDHARRELEMRLRASVLGIGHPERHVIRFPENWWEAVKERFAPTWFRDRWPVKFTTVTASLEEIYPEIPPALPHEREVMKFDVARRTETPVW